MQSSQMINERVRMLKDNLEKVCEEIRALNEQENVAVEFAITDGKLTRFIAYSRTPIKFEH